MRTVFVGTFVLLTAGICSSQTATPAKKPAKTLQIGPSVRQHDFAIDQMPSALSKLLDQKTAESASKQPTFSGKNFHLQVVPNPIAQASCFSMRTYIFSEGEGDSVPQRKGYTDCVPSSTGRLLEIEAAPEMQPE